MKPLKGIVGVWSHKTWRMGKSWGKFGGSVTSDFWVVFCIFCDSRINQIIFASNIQKKLYCSFLTNDKTSKLTPSWNSILRLFVYMLLFFVISFFFFSSWFWLLRSVCCITEAFLKKRKGNQDNFKLSRNP